MFIVKNETLAMRFCFCGGADDAATLEAFESAFFFKNFAWNEGKTKKLTVRVRQRGTGFTSVVHNCLCVANVRSVLVRNEATAKSQHQFANLLVREHVETIGVIGGEHEHFVSATCFRHHVHGTKVAHGE